MTCIDTRPTRTDIVTGYSPWIGQSASRWCGRSLPGCRARKIISRRVALPVPFRIASWSVRSNPNHRRSCHRGNHSRKPYQGNSSSLIIYQTRRSLRTGRTGRVSRRRRPSPQEAHTRRIRLIIRSTTTPSRATAHQSPRPTLHLARRASRSRNNASYSSRSTIPSRVIGMALSG